MKQFNAASYDVLNDPLSSAGRGSKKGVMTFSVVSIFLSFGNFNGEGFSMLGLKFDSVTPAQIYSAIAAILLYMSISFTVHVAADFRRYRYLHNLLKLEHAMLTDAAACTNPAEQQEQDFRESEFRSITGYNSYDFDMKDVTRLVWARFFLDFCVPLLVGALALFSIGYKIHQSLI